MTDFRTALTAQADRAAAACDRFGQVRAENHEAVMQAADKLEAAFGDALAGLERIRVECATNRVRAQASNRAKANGADDIAATIAADDAERYLHEGMSHHAAVTLAAGEYRVRVAA
jgi:hypothetical protein